MIVEPIKKEKKKRAPKKPLSELNESIKLEMKKERIFSKTKMIDTDVIDHKEVVIDSINNLISKSTKLNQVHIYILDKIYFNNDIRYLLDTPDTYTIIINNDSLYDELVLHSFDCSLYSELFLFDERKGLRKGLNKYRGIDS